MDLISLYECPVCIDFATPLTLQCQCDHIVCVSCPSMLCSCPTCSENLSKRLVASLIVTTSLECTALLRIHNHAMANSHVHLPSCLADIRNLAMKKLATSIFVPCRYALAGCTEPFHYTVKAELESVC
ncbi:unnamed protein product [Taenia asiatica]|uniref:RING-type domain-containing protein n=1 Tax=Taenia asiatica TaxID=60517 RepID=A0A0R3WBT5_TAEAS|nr:unnamed protein product [Taenia asiatica]